MLKTGGQLRLHRRPERSPRHHCAGLEAGPEKVPRLSRGALPGQPRLLLRWIHSQQPFKEVTIRADGKPKANVDAELVLQAMLDYPHYERAVIVTNDGDFACLVRHLYGPRQARAGAEPESECLLGAVEAGRT